MKETKRVSRLMLERYRLGDVSEEQRKLVEAELAVDEELRLYYESLKDSDREISRLYPFEEFPLLTAFQDAAVPAANMRPLLRWVRLYRKRLWGFAATAAVVVLIIVSYMFRPETVILTDEDITQAAGYNPNSGADLYIRNGNDHYDKGEYELAIDYYTQAIKLEVNNRNAYNCRGNAYYAMRNYDKAIEDYTRAIDLNPGDAGGFFIRGSVYYDKGEYDPAITDFTEAIQLNPKEAAFYNNRGTAYYAKGEYTKAIADYTQAISLNPNDIILYYPRGYTYYAMRDYDKAIEDYTQVIKFYPNVALFYNRRGDAYYAKGEHDRANADYETSQRLGSVN